MEGKFLFLGTGCSTGTPVITCSCAVCVSSDPHDKRLRPAGLLTIKGKRFLLDVGPDFRTQALTYEVKNLDALVLTHTHFDHIAGIDDLRVYNFLDKKPLPCLLSQSAYKDVVARYPYFFKENSASRFQFQILKEAEGEDIFEGVEWKFFSYFQNGMQVLGYRLGSFAYVLDIREYNKAIIEALSGVETLVLSALRPTTSPAHLSLNQAIEFAHKVGAKQTWFSHISHELPHEETNLKLPSSMCLAYDGLEIAFHVV